MGLEAPRKMTFTTGTIVAVIALTACANDREAEFGSDDPGRRAELLDICAARIIRYDGTDMKALDELSVELARGGAILLIGARHGRDPADPQNARLATAFADFGADLALYEGPDRGEADTAEATIRQMGESGYLRFLAKRAHVDIGRLEPDPRNELIYVLEEFSIQQAALFYLLRSAAQWREREGLSDDEIDLRMNDLLRRASDLFGSLPPPHNAFRLDSVGHLGDLYAEYFSKPADWRDAPMRWFSPEQKGEDTGGRFLNAVNARSSDFRNLHMYRAAAGPSLRGERVFGVVGGDHLARLKPAFECLDASA